MNLELENFHHYAYSHLINNTTRGHLAEYIVALALGVQNKARVEWDVFDLTGPDGTKVEVKSAARVQAWHDEKSKPSSIQFNVGPTRAWDPEKGYDAERKRQADVYVFALYDGNQKANEALLDTNNWRFWILSADRLGEAIGNQASLGIARLKELAEGGPLSFEALAAEVKRLGNK